MSKDKKTKEDAKAIKEWLEKNKVTICPEGEYTDPEEITYIYKAGKRK